MTSSDASQPAESNGAATTTTTMTPPVDATAQPKQPLHFSKKTIRQMERGSAVLFALAQSSKGSQASRISLAANELLREIVEGNVDKKTLEQLEFFASDLRLKEEAAEPIVYLAKSILAMGRSMAGLEDVIPPSPAFRIKPPVDFGDGDDGAENMFLVPSGSAPSTQKRLKIPILYGAEEVAVEGDNLNTSNNTETSGSTEEKDKPVGAENDFCVRVGPVHMFRPLTPEGETREERSMTPSPPPSPTIRAMLQRKRRYGDEEEFSDEDEEDFYDDDHLPETETSSSVEKEGMPCSMCDMLFYDQDQLDGHLIGYHRMKPLMADGYEEPSHFREQQSAAVRRPSHSHHSQAIGGSPVILSTKPLNVFGMQHQHQQHQPMRAHGGAMGTSRATEQLRHSSTMVTSPGGTIRSYSSPSNAARAAAKAAAAAAAGIFRPNAPMKPYTCRQCGVVLTSQQMYASHVRYNHPKEKNGETAAAKPRITSDRKETAIVHLQMDDGTKAFKCRRCDKVFDSAQKVAGHSRHCLLVFEGKARPANQGPVPTEDRPYTVYRCGLNSDLARTCPYCGELLPSIRKVDKHVRTVHEASRHEVYGCSTCDRRFVTLGGIENHWLHYGDCPQGVLTVHKDGQVTCADIGDIPPPLKRPRMVLQASASRRKEPVIVNEEEEDPTVSIVNAILGAHRAELGGFQLKNRDAPDLSPKMGDSDRVETEDEEEAAPELEEYGEEGDEEMADTLMNGDAHLDEEMDDEEEEISEEDEATTRQKEKIIVSMKLSKCKHCTFFARTTDAMDSHMNELHPAEALAEFTLKVRNGDNDIYEVEEEDALPTTSVSPELNEDVKLEPVAPKLELEDLKEAKEETKQTGEMRRMLGMASD